jgi:hypothetical protein
MIPEKLIMGVQLRVNIRRMQEGDAPGFPVLQDGTPGPFPVPGAGKLQCARYLGNTRQGKKWKGKSFQEITATLCVRLAAGTGITGKIVQWLHKGLNVENYFNIKNLDLGFRP